jgi:hypothetical protein
MFSPEQRRSLQLSKRLDVLIDEIATEQPYHCKRVSRYDDPQLLAAIIVHLRRELNNCGLHTSSDGRSLGPIKALCLSQPHGGLKNIRTAAWLAAITLADGLGIEFMWSSDSDTLILPDTISSIVTVLQADNLAGGASSMICVDKPLEAVQSAVFFACNIYLKRGALGAFGKSDCLMGPSCAFKVATVREIILPWTRYTVFGRQTVSTETNTGRLVLNAL